MCSNCISIRFEFQNIRNQGKHRFLSTKIVSTSLQTSKLRSASGSTERQKRAQPGAGDIPLTFQNMHGPIMDLSCQCDRDLNQELYDLYAAISIYTPGGIRKFAQIPRVQHYSKLIPILTCWAFEIELVGLNTFESCWIIDYMMNPSGNQSILMLLMRSPFTQ